MFFFAAQSPSVAETLHPAFTGVQQYAGTSFPCLPRALVRLIRSSGKLFCLLGIQLCIQPPPSLPSLRASLSHLPFCSSSNVKVRIRVGMRVQDGAGGCAELLHPELMEGSSTNLSSFVLELCYRTGLVSAVSGLEETSCWSMLTF